MGSAGYMTALSGSPHNEREMINGWVAEPVVSDRDGLLQCRSARGLKVSA